MGFDSEVSLISVAKLRYQTLSDGLNIPEPVSVPLVRMKAGKKLLPLKKNKKPTEEEATAGLAAAKDVSVDAVAAAAVLLHLDGNEEQKTKALKAFLCGKRCCLSTPDTAAPHGSAPGSDTRLASPLAPIASLTLAPRLLPFPNIFYPNVFLTS